MADTERYARHLSLDGIGSAGQDQLARSSVLVLGAGGLGSPVITYLAAAGVGRVTIVDDDVVSMSNLQRQVIHTVRDLDRPKVESAACRAMALNPEVHVSPLAVRLNASNVDELIAGHDVVVDACDNFVARQLLADACQRAGVPEVYGAVLAWQGQTTVLEPGRTLESVFGTFPDDAPTGAQVGILAMLPGVIGAVMATETLKLLLGEPDTLAGRLQTYDARRAVWRTYALPPLETDAPAATPPAHLQEVSA